MQGGDKPLRACKELAESSPALSASVCDQLQLRQRQQLDVHQLDLGQGHVVDPLREPCTGCQKGIQTEQRIPAIAAKLMSQNFSVMSALALLLWGPSLC